MKRSLLACIVLCLALTGCKKSEPAASTPAAPSPAQGAPVVAAKSLSSLVGKWRRADGDYALVIKSIASDGKAEATYFNPNPINVSWAQARVADTQLKLDVELRDVNYPGCLYQLTTSDAPNVLSGTYYQAMTKETYSVSFVREP